MDITSSQTKCRRVEKLQYTTSGAPLKLPSLPRFHPAIYELTSSSASTTSSSQGTCQQPLMSLQSQQRQLYVYQREMLGHAAGVRSPYGTGYTSDYDTQYLYGATSSTTRPNSPKLMPMADSPGLVTPLELEGEGYLTASSNEASRRKDRSLRQIGRIEILISGNCEDEKVKQR